VKTLLTRAERLWFNDKHERLYVFEPPEGTKMEYAVGEKMRFGFTVVGRAAEYMTYFIYAFSKMGTRGSDV
jgi:hypothetical protein